MLLRRPDRDRGVPLARLRRAVYGVRRRLDLREALYGPRPDDDTRYVEEVLRQTWLLRDDEVERILWAREAGRAVPRGVPRDRAVGRLHPRRVHLGLPAEHRLARARRPREGERIRGVTIAFGGANWEEAMGVALLRRFPFVDLEQYVMFLLCFDYEYACCSAASRSGTSAAFRSARAAP